MNADRVQALAARFLEDVRAHYTADPAPAPERVWEVLNALGCVAGMILTGTGPAQEAIDFFNSAVSLEIKAMTGPGGEGEVANG